MVILLVIIILMLVSLIKVYCVKGNVDVELFKCWGLFILLGVLLGSYVVI